MKPPSKYLKLDQVIDVLLHSSDNESNSFKDEEEEDELNYEDNKSISNLGNISINESKTKNLKLEPLKKSVNENDTSEDSDDDLPLSKFIIKKGLSYKIDTLKKMEDPNATRRVPSRQQSKLRLIKRSSLKKEKQKLELNFLKGLFDFDTIIDTSDADDPNTSLVYSDIDEMDETEDNDDNKSSESIDENDKENISNTNRSPILILQNTSHFFLSTKNLKRKC